MTQAPGAPGATALRCADCDGEIGSDGYCNTCGMAAPEPVDLDDRGAVAAATHRGHRRSTNQDVTALATTREGWPVLVVADGVARSPNPAAAARSASFAAANHLAGEPFTGQDDLAGAVRAAQEAASTTPADDPEWTDDGSHPACTLVVAVPAREAVYVANVGDTRAYLLEPLSDADQGADGWTATQLTTDHSQGHALTSWLGADSPAEAHFSSHPATPGDLILACSDGLWNYVADDAALGQLMGRVADPPHRTSDASEHTIDLHAAPVCERLVSWALAQGGADNVSVALAPLDPGPSTENTKDENTENTENTRDDSH